MSNRAYDPLLYGRGSREGITKVEYEPPNRAIVFEKLPYATTTLEVIFDPWMLVSDADALSNVSNRKSLTRLKGEGRRFLARFGTWRDLQQAVWQLSGGQGRGSRDPNRRPYRFPNPVTQFMVLSGQTPFKGLELADIEMLAIDIEVYTPPGSGFPNAERGSDRVILAACADNHGWSTVLGSPDMNEKELLEEVVKLVRWRDPDFLLGHNIHQFDLAYLMARCKRHRVEFGIGRDTSAPRRFKTIYKVGEGTKPYTNCEVYGRTVVDTLHLAQRWDAIKRELPNYKLKDTVAHLGLAKADRTMVEGSQISRVWEQDPGRVIRYAGDDAEDVIKLAELLLPSEFYQAQMLPNNPGRSFSMGPAGKTEQFLVRGYLARGKAISLPQPKQQYEGAYIDLFWQGVLPSREASGRAIAKLDVDAMYPNIMLTHKLAPASDTEGIFLRILRILTGQRMAAKARAKELKKAGRQEEHARYDAQQAAYKVLINGAYGYLGYPYGSFNDYEKAAEVTRIGRELARKLVAAIEARGGIPVEVDTDGVLFVVPEA